MSAPLSSPDPAGTHPDVDELADLAEGLVEPADAAEALWRHVDGCAECRETVEALAEVRDLLGDVETPPMPADVAARLDAALAGAAATAPPPAPAASATPATTPTAAAAVTEPVAVPRPPTAPPGRPAASTTGPGRSRKPWRRRLGLLVGTAAAAAAVGLIGSLTLRGEDRTSSSTAGAPAKAAATPSGAAARADRTPGTTVYREDQLTLQIGQLLARSGTGSAQPPAEPGLRSPAAQPGDGRPEQPALSSPSTGSSTDPTACPPLAPGVPLATDRGTYDGAPVEVLVYPSPADRSKAEVYLRSPGCGPVLLHRTVPVPVR